MHSPNFARWTDAEVECFLNLLETGGSTLSIAHALGREEDDVKQQARFLGVQLPEPQESGLLTRTEDSSAANAVLRYVPFRPRRTRN